MINFILIVLTLVGGLASLIFILVGLAIGGPAVWAGFFGILWFAFALGKRLNRASEVRHDAEARRVTYAYNVMLQNQQRESESTQAMPRVNMPSSLDDDDY